MVSVRLAILALAVPLLLSGCAVVQSERPLSAAKVADRDPRLEGIWREQIADQETDYFCVAYGADAHGTILQLSKDKAGAAATPIDFFVTRTPRHSYLNLLQPPAPGPGRSHSHGRRMYEFAEYHFSWRGQLLISPVGGTGFAEALKRGVLHGKNDGSTVTIAPADAGRIPAFIEGSKRDDVLWPPFVATKIGRL